MQKWIPQSVNDTKTFSTKILKTLVKLSFLWNESLLYINNYSFYDNAIKNYLKWYDPINEQILMFLKHTHRKGGGGMQIRT